MPQSLTRLSMPSFYHFTFRFVPRRHNSHRTHHSSRLPTNFPKLPQPPRHCLTRPATCPQRVHCEDDPLDPVYQRGSEDSALCSGILALEAGTSLLLYPSGPEGAALPVLLDAGDLLLFRGDCWHAGAGYACLNRRIHFYLSAPRRRWKPGYTYWYTPPATATEPLAKRVRTQRIRLLETLRPLFRLFLVIPTSNPNLRHLLQSNLRHFILRRYSTGPAHRTQNAPVRLAGPVHA